MHNIYIHVSVCWWLADTLVCVDVALAVGAGVYHILEIIDQTGNQAAAQITPNKEAEEAEDSVHEAHAVVDAGDDGLLAVVTHSLYGCCLEYLPL